MENIDLMKKIKQRSKAKSTERYLLRNSSNKLRHWKKKYSLPNNRSHFEIKVLNPVSTQRNPFFIKDTRNIILCGKNPQIFLKLREETFPFPVQFITVSYLGKLDHKYEIGFQNISKFPCVFLGEGNSGIAIVQTLSRECHGIILGSLFVAGLRGSIDYIDQKKNHKTKRDL